MFYSDFILYEDARSNEDRRQPQRITLPKRYMELNRHGIEERVVNPFLPMRKEVLLGRTNEILTLLRKQTNPEKTEDNIVRHER